GQSDDEQRRLAYVALTRARQALLLTGSHWWSQTRPRMPGAFLRELHAAGHLPTGRLPDAPPDGPNPLAAVRSVCAWPLDPLGVRAPAVRAAAAAVRAADPG